MALTKKEEEELKAAEKRCWDYDPDEEEVDAKYDDDFDDEIMAMIDEKLK